MGLRAYRPRPAPTSSLPAPAQKRVLGYLRVSSDMQADEGYSLASQEAGIEAWCRSELGEGNYRLTIERDEGLSGSLPYLPPKPGSSKFRPGLGRAVQRLQAGEADFFVVYRVNRLFRDNLQQLIFLAEFFPQGSSCKLVALAEHIDLDTIGGELTAQLLGAVGDYERKQISQNLKVANAARRREGYPTGQIPYGWRRTPRTPGVRSGIVPVPEELRWARRCFELSLAGRGVREIARELEREGAPPPGRTGRWDELKVHRLLQIPLYAGLIWDGETTREGAHAEARILEPEEWHRVQAGLQSRMRERIPYAGKGLRPLYNVGRCGTCGGKLRVVEVDGVVAYRCAGSAAQGDVLPPTEAEREPGEEEPEAGEAGDYASSEPGDGDLSGAGEFPERESLPAAAAARRVGATGAWCPGWQKRADDVDQVLLELLTEAVRLPEFVALAEAEARGLLVQEGQAVLREREAGLQRTLTDVRRQLERLVDLYIDEKLSRELYDAKYAALTRKTQEAETELADLRRRLSGGESDAQLLERIRAGLTDLPRLWPVLHPEERRQLVADLTEYVVVERSAYRQSRLRVKVHFLPEAAAPLPHAHSLEGGYGAGVAGLTPRELALLFWVREGRTPKQIAAHWQADVGGIYVFGKRILKRLGVATLEEAVSRAWERLEAERERLPLDEASRSGCQSWRHSQQERMGQILAGYRRGMTRAALAAELGMALQSIRHYEWKACKGYGVKTLAEALAHYAAENPGSESEDAEGEAGETGGADAGETGAAAAEAGTPEAGGKEAGLRPRGTGEKKTA